MKRRLFTILAALSLLLCLASTFLWIRSIWFADILYANSDLGWTASVQSVRGRLPIGVSHFHKAHYLHAGAGHVTVSANELRLPSSDSGWRFLGFSIRSESYTAACGFLIVTPYWFICLVTAPLPIRWFRRWRQLRRARLQGLCPTCGYDLRATKDRCPECGTPVALTTSLGRDLAQARPAYVRRLAWACWLLLAARCMLLAVVLGPFVAPYGASFLPISDHSLAALFPLSGISLTALLLLIGAWFLTGREHPQFPSEMPRTALAIRILPLVGCIALTPVISNEASRLLAGFSIFASPIIPSMDLLRILLCVSVLVYALYPAAEMRLMVHLSRRLANASLGRRALVTGIGASVGGLGCFVIITLMLTFPSLDFTSYTNAMGYSFGFALALTLVCWLWTAFVCLIAARSFARAAQAARHWSAHSTSEAPRQTGSR